MIRFCTAAFVFLFPLALFAQKASDLKRNGEKMFEARRYAEALSLLARYQQEKPGETAVLTKLGICNYYVNQPDKARQYLEYILKQNPATPDPEVYLYMARTLHGQREFDKAIPFYKGFLERAGEKHPLRANVTDNIRRCALAIDIPDNPAVALVENLGPGVNSTGDEFAPLPSVNNRNRLYFAAARDSSIGGRRNNEGYEDAVAGHFCTDMMFSDLRTSGWSAAEPLASLLNTSRHEVPLCFDEKGQLLYFFRGFTHFSGEMLIDSAGRNDEFAVTSPSFQGPLSVENGDAAPFFFNDTILLFASRREGGLGGLDLYVSFLRDSAWTVAQNLGPEVNSPYDETTPFLARNGRSLYFSSNRLSSMGGLDVFNAVFDDKTALWQAPVNMGPLVNSPADDAFFRLANDGAAAYFASSRFESLGERDLFVAWFREAQEDHLEKSNPPTFAQVKAPAKASEQKEFVLPVMLYTDERDVLNPDNLKAIDQFAAAARLVPDAVVLVTVHTDETGPAKFDLYNGIKRAELVGKALTERGVPASRIRLRSCGPYYPVARNVMDAAPNPMGSTLNRRIELALPTVSDAGLPVLVRQEKPVVSELMASEGAEQYAAMMAGVSYRVDVTTTRQLLNNDVLAMYRDQIIDNQQGTGLYLYTAGLFKDHAKAVQLRKELQNQGFAEATVGAYVHGIRISKAEAVALLKKYPELTAFVRG
ncbi:MAG: PD40 domain-containing protein [Saprospiraceae bacterium]|nr:PD40 domain-containing protein [Saprospiraceae bacterium]